MKKIVLGVMKNIVGKEENAGNEHLSPFQTMLSLGFFLALLKCNSSPDEKIPLFLHYTNCILQYNTHSPMV